MLKKLNQEISIIIFSKDRPMQLHGLLESLFYYSGIFQYHVTVLYKCSSQYSYKNVMQCFQLVHWVEEKSFFDDLISLLESSNRYIMFCCDDVLFKHGFLMSEARERLEKDKSIFGFSFRLGSNITGYPHSNSSDNYVKWNWRQAKALHYNYPFELTSTLYRKTDVLKIIELTPKKLCNPNFFEQSFYDLPDSQKNEFPNNLACFKQLGCVVIITVNRVQDTHPNAFCNKKNYTTSYLNKLYNEQSVTMDIHAISNISHQSIHVDSEYFLLRKSKFRKLDSFYGFFKQFKTILNYRTKVVSSIKSDQFFDNYFQSLEYKRPNIMSAIETVDELINNNVSFCRFGDGELMLIEGQGIAFQDYNTDLQKRLKEVLASNNKEIYVGLPHLYYYYSQDFIYDVKVFLFHNMQRLDSIIKKHYLPEKQYYDTGFSQVFHIFNQNYSFGFYYEYVKNIWKNKDVVIIVGHSCFSTYYPSIFDCAKSIEYLYCPSKNAFDNYSDILSRALKIDKSKRVLIILGPTATVLAYDLAKQGYCAMDIGHIAKDYHYYLNKKESDISDFFKPD
jgi:glycosyltransferase family protein